ncbi:cation diffusion facilitator family transporter [Brevibacterium daeguense]|uniref:Cation diffusion facilitator family transporter n=1 Tax=Brevibacterium daeguense TaxID=909936 RepID=A0ABP8ENW8_9MICO|nr:cation diffusion facilitator family transporter [Brevibacterium daeguense]
MTSTTPHDPRSASGADAPSLTSYAWLSIAAALVTIGLKTLAWKLTGSVGLLSDAAESVVNLGAAIAALVALVVAARPADKNHQYGHSKAEYFSAVLEGVMIFVAAAFIIYSSVVRFFNPQELENVGVGLGVSLVAGAVNGAVALVLLRVGKRHRSITLTADGKHLMTDVWTSIGVVVGVFLVFATGWNRLDAVVALAVGINILVTGWRLIAASTAGLMDVSLPQEDNDRIRAILDGYAVDGIEFHQVRTREAGRLRFMDTHLLVPGSWTVQRAHDLSREVAAAVRSEYPDLRVTNHVEPIEDPASHHGSSAAR